MIHMYYPSLRYDIILSTLLMSPYLIWKQYIQDILVKNDLWKFFSSLKYEDLNTSKNKQNVFASTSLNYILGDTMIYFVEDYKSP